jgi:hypothetical protein
VGFFLHFSIPQKFRPLKTEYFIYGGDIIHYYLDVRWLQGYPLCASDFQHFLERFSNKEIDHLSLLDFFQFHNFSEKVKLFQLPAPKGLG